MKMIQKALAVLCMVIMLLGCLSASVLAEGAVATPTDLGPVATGETVPAEDLTPETEKTEEAPVESISPEECPEAVSEEEIEEGDLSESEPSEEYAAEEFSEEEVSEEQTEEETNEDESAPGIEIVIAKSLQLGQSWNGTIKRKTPTILKLDMNRAQMVYILVEGEDVLAAVQKADRFDDTISGILTDAETNELIIELNADAGSYLISLKAGENSLLAKVTVTIMDQTKYNAWNAEHQGTEEDERQEEATEEVADETETELTTSSDESEADPEQITEAESEAEENMEETSQEKTEDGLTEEPEAEPETEPEEELKEETEEEPDDVQEIIPETERSIEVKVTWDVPDPMIGDTAHFRAVLTGYEGLNYTMQWQFSPDQTEWMDVDGETKDTMDVIVTEENNLLYWRIVVYLEQEQEC